jgi:hypothetical protein
VIPKMAALLSTSAIPPLPSMLPIISRMGRKRYGAETRKSRRQSIQEFVVIADSAVWYFARLIAMTTVSQSEIGKLYLMLPYLVA